MMRNAVFLMNFKVCGNVVKDGQDFMFDVSS